MDSKNPRKELDGFLGIKSKLVLEGVGAAEFSKDGQLLYLAKDKTLIACSVNNTNQPLFHACFSTQEKFD
jgi:hypothetical protein